MSRYRLLILLFVLVLLPVVHAAEVRKTITYALLEDYNKGTDLHVVEQDFKLMRSRGIDTWRGSLGWNDYEPQKGVYDFTWLHSFATLAQAYGIKLRPYLAFTATWASPHPNSPSYWSYPPEVVSDWSDFCSMLAKEMSVHPNVLSFEIYNEINSTDWWKGTPAQYTAVLRAGAEAIRAANPHVQVIMAGLVFPDYDWLNAICSDFRSGATFDIAPFHAYPETWEDSTVETYLDSQYYGYYVPEVNHVCGAQPIWINELGYATTRGITEQQQSYWWARAFATFLSRAEIQELGIYQIRDVPAGNPVIGGSANYHLGITKADRTPKLAYYTIGMLVHLLPPGIVTTADSDLVATVTAGEAVEPYYHLFRRPDGHQIVFAYDKQGTVTVNLKVPQPGSSAIQYGLDGTATAYGAFDGTTLTEVALIPGQIAIFDIAPEFGVAP